jgi:phage shock protein C
MFCSKCGNSVDPSSRFCPSCGAPVYAATTAYPPPPPPAFAVNRLTRPRENRMIAGVCAAFALHYGWDLSVVRIVTALLVILTGVGAIAYLVAWVAIPEAPHALPAKSI